MEMWNVNIVLISIFCQWLIGKEYVFGSKLRGFVSSEPEGRFVYVMERAVTAFESGDSGSAPIPPCISAFDKDGCQIGLEVEDQSTRSVLLKVGVDIVRISIMNSVSHEQANNEILKLFGKILTCRSSQMTVMKGHSTRHKILLIQNLSPQEVPSLF